MTHVGITEILTEEYTLGREGQTRSDRIYIVDNLKEILVGSRAVNGVLGKHCSRHK